MIDDRETRIRQRAYEIWEQKGRPEGEDKEHWEQAARELGADFPDDPAKGSLGTLDAGPAGQESGNDPTAAGDGPPKPEMSGAPAPAADTSKSNIANRDEEGPRKAGVTPRPTDRPLSD